MGCSIVIKSQYRIAVELPPRQLQQVGPLISGYWSRPSDELGRVMRGQFLIDTGAYGAMIDLDVAQTLELAPQGLRQIHGIHGSGRLELFVGRLSLPAHDGAGHRTEYVTDTECVAVAGLCAKNREQGVEIIGILGRIFLAGSRLTIDSTAGTVDLVLPEREDPL